MRFLLRALREPFVTIGDGKHHPPGHRVEHSRGLSANLRSALAPELGVVYTVVGHAFGASAVTNARQGELRYATHNLMG